MRVYLYMYMCIFELYAFEKDWPHILHSFFVGTAPFSFQALFWICFICDPRLPTFANFTSQNSHLIFFSGCCSDVLSDLSHDFNASGEDIFAAGSFPFYSLIRTFCSHISPLFGAFVRMNFSRRLSYVPFSIQAMLWICFICDPRLPKLTNFISHSSQLICFSDCSDVWLQFSVCLSFRLADLSHDFNVSGGDIFAAGSFPFDSSSRSFCSFLVLFPSKSWCEYVSHTAQDNPCSWIPFHIIRTWSSSVAATPKSSLSAFF